MPVIRMLNSNRMWSVLRMKRFLFKGTGSDVNHDKEQGLKRHCHDILVSLQKN